MFDTNPVLLNALLNNVEKGGIQLPDFQRGWVWDNNRIKGLLASISRGFPVGAVMTLEAGGDIRFKTRLVEGISEKNGIAPNQFLLDGQQRLTSLYQALLHPGPVSTQDSRGKKLKRWYYIDMQKVVSQEGDREDAIVSVPKDKRVTRNFGRETVRDLSSLELEYENHMFPTERLFDHTEWLLGYIDYWSNGTGVQHPAENPTRFFMRFNDLVIKPFVEYQLPVIRLQKQTPKEAVCTVFEKVNTGGVSLTVFELVTASFAAESEEFSLRDNWSERRQRLHSRFGVLQGIEGEHFLQAITLLKTQEDRRRAEREGHEGTRLPPISCKRRDVLDLRLQDYEEWADKVEGGFRESAKFLDDQFVYGRRNVPYNTQLVPLAALYVELGDELIPAKATERLAHWYWSGIFGEAYGGTTETQYALDLAQVAEYIRTGVEPTLITQANFVPERLLTLRTRLSAAYKGIYALQMKNGAKDWRSDRPISRIVYHNDNIDIHHVFPVAWCRSTAEPAIPRRLYDSVINKTPLSATTNGIIGGRAPAVYLKRLEEDMGGDEKLERALEAHWFDPRHLKENNFRDSFIARGELLLELIGKAMGRELASGREVFQNALSEVFKDMPPLTSEEAESYQDEEPEYEALGDDSYDEERVAEAG